jgi:hypothetical protein
MSDQSAYPELMKRKRKEWAREQEYLVTLWSTPSREAMTRYDNNAFETAKLILQSLLLVHGSALIAVPTFAKILPDHTLSSRAVVMLVIVFTVGIVFALVAALLTFFACAHRSDEHLSRIEAYQDRAWARVADDEYAATGNEIFFAGSEKSNKAADEIDKKVSLSFDAYLQQRRWAIIFIVLSLIMIVIAGSIGTWSVLFDTPVKEDNLRITVPMWD